MSCNFLTTCEEYKLSELSQQGRSLSQQGRHPGICSKVFRWGAARGRKWKARGGKSELMGHVEDNLIEPAHSVMYANKLVTTRRAIGSKNTSRSQ
eukprot:1122867-Pelagomonas_calceolata.AAC.1